MGRLACASGDQNISKLKVTASVVCFLMNLFKLNSLTSLWKVFKLKPFTFYWNRQETFSFLTSISFSCTEAEASALLTLQMCLYCWSVAVEWAKL